MIFNMLKFFSNFKKVSEISIPSHLFQWAVLHDYECVQDHAENRSFKHSISI